MSENIKRPLYTERLFNPSTNSDLKSNSQGSDQENCHCWKGGYSSWLDEGHYYCLVTDLARGISKVYCRYKQLILILGKHHVQLLRMQCHQEEYPIFQQLYLNTIERLQHLFKAFVSLCSPFGLVNMNYCFLSTLSAGHHRLLWKGDVRLILHTLSMAQQDSMLFYKAAGRVVTMKVSSPIFALHSTFILGLLGEQGLMATFLPRKYKRAERSPKSTKLTFHFHLFN